MLAAVGVVLVAVLCCAGPVLLAGGTLSGIGAALRSPWLIGAGALLLVAGVIFAAVRRKQGRFDGDSCCQPQAHRGLDRGNRSAHPRDKTGKRTR